MIGTDSEPRQRRLSTTAQQRGKMPVTQPKWRQFCVEDGCLLEIVFFCDQIYFCRLTVSDWFWLRINVYALGDLMGHYYVHFAFVFTLTASRRTVDGPLIWTTLVITQRMCTAWLCFSEDSYQIAHNYEFLFTFTSVTNTGNTDREPIRRPNKVNTHCDPVSTAVEFLCRWC